MKKFKEFLIQFIDAAQKQKKVILALSCFVVFVTTYMLILPAFTLEKDKAIEQGGIDVPEEGVLLEETSEEDVDSESASVETTDDYQEAEQGESKADQLSETVGEPLTYDGGNYTVTVEDRNSILPANTEIRVNEIDKSADYKAYKSYFDDALAAVQSEDDGNSVSDLEFAKFYDIKLVADGEEIMLTDSDTVNVRIDYNKDLRKDLNVENKDNVRIIHFAENKETGKEEAEVLDNIDANVEINTDNKDRLTDMSFEAGSFSVYAVVYTVDFSYEVNGNNYLFSMQGADSVSLRDLIAALHVYESDSSDKETKDKLTASDLETVDKDEGINSDRIDAFMADIKDVTFSNPKLLAVIKVDQKTTLGEINANNGILQHFTLNSPQKEVIERNAKAFDAGDWALISLEPFDTKETLSIEMENGETISINVTDAQDAIMDGDHVQTIDNPSGTTIDLFDYWILDELKDTAGRNAWPGGYTSGGWTDDWEYTSDGGYDFTLLVEGQGTEAGINEGHPFKFSPAWEHTVRDGNSSYDNTNGTGRVNSYTGSGDPNQGLVTSLLVDGYPQLSGDKATTNESLNYLFDASEHLGKERYGNVNQLLYVDKDGYYTYDSRDYAAAFDESSKTFTVTEQTASTAEGRGFWPFGTENYWTGMHMNTQFSMPANGQVLNPKDELRDMQFEFSGDDDTWLYVDGVLVGDGGGIHNRTEIDINFAAGTVTVTGKKDTAHMGSFEETKYLDDIFKAVGKYKDADWEDLNDGSGHKRFKAGTYHTFDMFYLERGGGESNLYIHYNLVSTDDFTAHKSYEGFSEEERMGRDQFHFEMIGLDGQYQYVWDSDTDTETVTKLNDDGRAIMPEKGTENGTGSYGDPQKLYNSSAYTDSTGNTLGGTVYTTGVVENGDIRFGKADISATEMLNCDHGHPSLYRYIIREIIPNDAVNKDGVKWEDANEEQKAAGGFVKDQIKYDNKIYYMTARVTSWEQMGSDGQTHTAYGLKKTYYTDDTFTEVDDSVVFVDFRNRYAPESGGVEFTKLNETNNPLQGAEFTLYTDSACTKVAKDLGNEEEGIAGTNQIKTSGIDGKVSFENLAAPRTYYMKETAAPTGYALSETVYKVFIEDSADNTKRSRIVAVGDDSETEITKIINVKAGEISVIKEWMDQNGKVIEGGGSTATVQLRRYKYEIDESYLQSHNLTINYTFTPYSTGVSETTTKTLQFTGPTVSLVWVVPGGAADGVFSGHDNCSWDDESKSSVFSRTFTDVTSDITVDIVLNEYWVAQDKGFNIESFSIAENQETPKTLVQDTEFPAETDEKATRVLSAGNNWAYSWKIGDGTDDDFPTSNENGNYLYYVVELDSEGNVVEEGDQVSDNITLSGITYNPLKKDDKGIIFGTALVTNIKEVEMTSAKVLKVWNHGNNPSDKQPESLVVNLSNGECRTLSADNEWQATVDNLPKYDNDGNLIEYTWTESELPAGYYLSDIQEATDETTGIVTTTLTNSYTDHYNPTTTIKGKKVWDDGGNSERPSSITVNLYKDDGSTPYRTITVQAPTGEGTNQNEWPFEFTNLPVFNEDGSVIQYTVEEVLPDGYDNEYGIKIEFSQATYIAGDATGTIVNSGEGSQTFKISDGFNLGYIVIRHGNDFIIWTPRSATNDEITAIKTKVVDLSNQFNGINSATGDSMKIVSGVPDTVDVGKKHAVSVYMQNGEVWIKFLNPNAWSDFAYGTIPYTYTQAGGEGGGTITNAKKTTDFGFSKKWIDQSAQEIAWDKDIRVTVSRNKADGSKDTSFSLIYDITKNSVVSATGGTAEYSATDGAATDPKLKLTITTEGNIKKYNFSIEDLAYSSEADGKYTYYVEETNQQLEEYLAPRYTNTSAPTGTTEAYDGGAIINQQEGGVELPHTGGIGTAIFYVFGSLSLIGCGMALVLHRRTRGSN